jgi:pimeloyl-ACP methyl ester carboxylesterase
MNPRRILKVGLLLAAVALGSKLMLDAFVRQTLYPRPAVAVPSPPPAPLREVHLDTAAGDRVVGWAGGEGAPESAPLALFFHGNGENLETMRWAGLFAALDRLGVAYLAIDYPGYGGSGGAPSEPGLLAAADAALEWGRRSHPSRPVVACGWSLGAAVAVALAARRPDAVRALVAMSPWTSLPDLAASLFPLPMIRHAVRERYDSLAAAPAVRVPALVVHGERDRIIPVGHGERVARALGGEVRWVPVTGAGHNDLLGQPEVWEELRRFLRAVPARPVR